MFLLAYVEAERLLGCSENAQVWHDPCLPLLMVLAASLTTITLTGLVGLVNERRDNQ
jgi:formate-dependent nitrite reductase membrane component NrfD